MHLVREHLVLVLQLPQQLLVCSSLAGIGFQLRLLLCSSRCIHYSRLDGCLYCLPPSYHHLQPQSHMELWGGMWIESGSASLAHQRAAALVSMRPAGEEGPPPTPYASSYAGCKGLLRTVPGLKMGK